MRDSLQPVSYTHLDVYKRQLVHNAVNQVEDENFGENTICQVFQKGYKMGDKVIRHAMVVVANP